MHFLTLELEIISLLQIILTEISPSDLDWCGIGLFNYYLAANCLILILNAANNNVVNGDNQLKIA